MGYTPTTDRVRADYIHGVGGTTWYEGKADAIGSVFDCWLAEVKAQAWEEGWSTGRDVWTDRQATAEDMNPYQQGEGSGNGASQSPIESDNLLNGEEQ